MSVSARLTPDVTIGQWSATWRALGVADSVQLQSLFAQLIARYSEPHRHYHTVQHLHECFARMAEIRSLAERPGEVELALWFHDAVYDTNRKDNERKSADWARSSALAAGIPGEAGERVHSLIMFTRHAVEPVGADARVLVDVDLSILGAEPARFDEYEEQVRREYSWVPGPLFRRNRRKILKEFLARPSIFGTALFVERYEQQARSNINRSLVR